MRTTVRRVIPADDPYQDGHFPGRPVFPGVFLLELVCDGVREALRERSDGWQLRTVRRVRFSAPVFPGDHIDIGLEVLVDSTGGEVRAVCRRSDVIVARVAAWMAPGDER
jgi:3-hydroxyacyl-[acyl-carrier-protein] dehydratase